MDKNPLQYRPVLECVRLLSHSTTMPPFGWLADQTSHKAVNCAASCSTYSSFGGPVLMETSTARIVSYQ